MDGERWSDDRFNDPRLEEAPFASEVKLGELDLRPGQRFLYVFDFGDNWNFWVQVVNIDPAVSEPGKPEIIEEKGESPKQYEYEDD